MFGVKMMKSKLPVGKFEYENILLSKTEIVIESLKKIENAKYY